MADIDRAEEGPEPRDSSWASNAELVSAMQEQWIDFICDDTVDGQDTIAIVYEVDRKVYHRNIEEDEEWGARAARLSELKGHLESVKSLEAAIRHLS